MRPLRDQVPEQPIWCRFQGEPRGVPPLRDGRDALDPGPMPLERFLCEAADDQFPAAYVERVDVRHGSGRHEAPAGEDGHATAQRLGVGQYVRAEEDGAPAVAPLENQIADLAA